MLSPQRLIKLTEFSWNHSQCCCTGTHIFVQSGIYGQLIVKFTETVKAVEVGDHFGKETNQGPQVSQAQLVYVCPPSSITRITVCNLARVPCHTLNLASNRVPRSTLMVVVLERRVTLSRYAYPFSFCVVSELIEHV
jgi:hypothetical protein